MQNEYLYYTQKFFDLSENISDSTLKKDIVNTFLHVNDELCKLAKFDIDYVKNIKWKNFNE